VNVQDTTDPQTKYVQPFIVDSLTISDKIHEMYIKYFLSKWSLNHFKDDAVLAQIHSLPRTKDEMFC
jgi:hypothetical protein